MAKYSGPFNRDTEYLDIIADTLTGDEDIDRSHGSRKTVALQRLAEFIVGEGAGKYKNVQADWTEEDPENDAFIRNIPEDLVRDADYVHTDNNFTDEHKDKLENHVITDDYYTPEDSEKLASIEWDATHTDIDSEITPESTNPVESAAIHAALETKVDKVDGYALSKNDFTDELKAKLDAIEPEATHTDIDSAITSGSTNPVESAAIHAALATKVDKEVGRGLSDENFTRAEKLKLEAIEAQATRTIPDTNITASSHNVVESRAIYEALDTKVNKVSGKGLSTNDYTTPEKNKLAGIEANATNTVIDRQISDSSTNPVENRAIFDALSMKVDKVMGKALSDENFTLEEKTKLGRLDPDAPKITIARLIFDQESGEPAKLNLTWQECKDAISNGVLYYQESNGGLESICLCYRVETETSAGVTSYKVEFASFAAGIFEYFAASSADGYPAYVSEENFQPDMSVKVDKTTTVNGHALSSNVTITPNDISYEPTQQFDAGTIGNALNILRSVKADAATKVNGHSLESDVTVGAGDIAFSQAETYENNSLGKQVKDLTTASENLNDVKADKTTTVNGHALSANVVVGPGDIAYSDSGEYQSGSLGTKVKSLSDKADTLEDTKVDKVTTVNGHALSDNVVVGSGDIAFDRTASYDANTLGKQVKDLTVASESLGDTKADKDTTVNGHSLADDVVVGPEDIAYSNSTNYQAGSLGAKVKSLSDTADTLGSTKADKSTKVNGHALTDDVVVGPGDISYNNGAEYQTGSIGAKVKSLSDASDNLGSTKADKTTTVNGHALSANVVVGPGDIGYSDSETYNSGTVGAEVKTLKQNVANLGDDKVNKTTTVNGHALDVAAVEIGAGDIGYQTGTAYTTGSVGEKIGQLESGKVDKVTGYGLSKNDFTDPLKAKLDAIEAGSQVNVIESVKVNGTAQSVVNKSVDITVPTKTSDITNDSDFVTHADLSDANPVVDGVASPGTSQNFARADHIHPTDTSRAPLASPAFTGTPTAPTAASGTNTTQIATTEFVSNAITAAVASAFEIKGSKTSYTDLPASGNKSGDVWYVDDEQSTYFWDGEDWKLMGNAIDTTQFVTNDDVSIVTEAQIDALFNS